MTTQPWNSMKIVQQKNKFYIIIAGMEPMNEKPGSLTAPAIDSTALFPI